MSTVAQPQTVTEYIRAHADADPKTVLDLAIAETERVRAEAENRDREYRQQAEVAITERGLEATNMAGLWRVAMLFANSSLVPDHFKKKPENCFIALQMAHRCRVDPFAFMQKCYLVHGRPAIETQLAIAMLNASGLIKGRVTYELTGSDKTRKCVAKVVLADTGETVANECGVDLAMKMGWWSKEGSLWPRMTDLMLQYRSALWLIRTTFPEVLMGLTAVEEERDIDGVPAANGNATAGPVSGKGALDKLMERMAPAIAATPPEAPGVQQVEVRAAVAAPDAKPVTVEEQPDPNADLGDAGLADLYDAVQRDLLECATRSHVTDSVNKWCANQPQPIRDAIVSMGEQRAAQIRGGKGKQQSMIS